MKPVSLLEQADEAAAILSVLGNAKRLAIMCHLNGSELPVGTIAEKVGLSQSALSQHLAKLRDLGMVETRRDRQMIYYSCAPGLPLSLLEKIEDVFTEANA